MQNASVFYMAKFLRITYFYLPQSKEVQKESSSQATEKVVAEKPPTAQRKKRVFTEQEEKDTGNEDVIQTKVSKQPKTCIKLFFLFGSNTLTNHSIYYPYATLIAI